MGLEITKVAGKVKVLDSILKSWESGETKPTLVQAEKLANIYKRPLAVFFLPTPPKEPDAPKDFRVLPADQTKILSYETRIAIRRSWRLQTITIELLKSLNLRRKLGITEVRKSNDPEVFATTVRKLLKVSIDEQRKWKDSYYALKCWKKKVEMLGVSVYQFSMPLEETRGFSLSSSEAPAIVLNTRDAVNAMSFSLFHELCHLLMDTSGLCDMEMREGGLEKEVIFIEKFCNHFAGALLVPLPALKEHETVCSTNQARKWSDAELGKLALDFKVSQEVILRRLLILGLATEAFYLNKREQWVRRGPKKKKGGWVIPSVKCVSENGVPFISLVLDSYAGGKIPYADIADYLGIRAKHIPKVIGLISEGIYAER
jgi:Zn-dependent peptidase ImmA (M78 family)